MSSVERGMEDNQKSGEDNTKYDIGGNNDIKVEYNKCGAIYAMDVATAAVNDTTTGAIDSSYVVKNMYSILEGNPVSYADDSIYAGNSCDVNAISNPDNVAFLENSDILTIGEDTSKHENNVVWAYNVKTKELTRTFTTPLDAETTSPFWYNNLANGFGYLSVVTQHPMEDQEGATAAQKESAIGYVGPFTGLTDVKEVASISADINVKFEAIEVPTTEATQTTQQASTKAYVNGSEQTISYTTIMTTGTQDNSEVFGQSKDYQDNPITFTDGSPYVCNGTNDGVGSGLDYTSFLNVNEKLYMVSQFECQVGSMYMTELEQDATTGELTAKAGTLEFISQKDEFGGFVHCAGQKTPWESHLGSEEYEPNARAVETSGLDAATGSKYYDETAKFWGW